MSRLVSCPDCGTEVSPEATACPKCGRPKTGRSGIGCGALVIGALVLLALYDFARVRDDPEPTPQAARTTAAPAVADSRPAAVVLAELFQPPANPAEVDRLLSALLRYYKTPDTDENRRRAGSVFIGFRREEGIPEIELMRYMVRHPMPGTSFPEAAALCVAAYEIDYGTNRPR